MLNVFSILQEHLKIFDPRKIKMDQGKKPVQLCGPQEMEWLRAEGFGLAPRRAMSQGEKNKFLL